MANERFELSAGVPKTVTVTPKDGTGEPTSANSAVWDTRTMLDTPGNPVVTVAEVTEFTATLTGQRPGGDLLRCALTVNAPAHTTMVVAGLTVRDVSTCTFAEPESDPLPLAVGEEFTLTAEPRDAASAAHSSLTLSGVTWSADPPTGVVVIEATGNPLVVNLVGQHPGLCDVTVSGTSPLGHPVSKSLGVLVTGVASATFALS